jgi:predicted Fe-Mo cluster-binding NifX family protein
MKIAVSTKGPTLDSQLDPRFGRTTGFILYDSDSGVITYLDNASQGNQSSKPGITSAKMIVDEGADKLITGQMGPNAARVLERADVRSYYCSEGSVQEAIHALEQNQLRELSGKDVRQGPGKMGGRGAGGGRGVGRGRGGGAAESDGRHSTP